MDTIVLRDPPNLSWFTGARWHVPLTLNTACFDVVLTGLGPGTIPEVRVVTNAIEAPRLRDIEFAGQDVEFNVVPWTENRASRLPTGRSVAVDTGDGASLDVRADLAGLRRILNQKQRADLTDLSADLARITGDVVSALRPGITEQNIAGTLIAALLKEGIECVAIFVGSDERIGAHRHPLPTSNTAHDRVMVACCGRRRGLVGSITRMASFRPLRNEARKYAALLEVERAFLDHSKPGAVLGEVFSRGANAYAANRFDPDEWHRHHQGGITGYSPRELIATPDTDLVLQEGMVLGWNPSAAGFKVEDTALVTATGVDILTADSRWPTLNIGGRERPDLLEL
ncbi:M24 family metallopeptidase [Pseudarthrobacter sp. HLT3-5]|uniref:M24 family metallopeptidase n=2 Tax=Pseudarthrobacter cellobiosi TaxID=2953654 RepID=UPI00208FAE91|nr:M24 family metallopeptidase [Pseudarthrobacter sp. HLT3-5]MCO4274600.1 M24 family metallopeptidase [Pseudarthrobacter sp. HLT3-5]